MLPDRQTGRLKPAQLSEQQDVSLASARQQSRLKKLPSALCQLVFSFSCDLFWSMALLGFLKGSEEDTSC